jgi:hypothetical protein
MVKVHDISPNIYNRLQDLGGSKYMYMPFVARDKYELKICSYVDIIKTMHYIPIVNSKFLTIIDQMFHNISIKKSSMIIFVTTKLVLGSRPRLKGMRGELDQKSVSGFKHSHKCEGVNFNILKWVFPILELESHGVLKF